MIVKCSGTLFISRALYNNIVIRTYITWTKYDYDKKERLLLMLLSRTLFHGFFLFKYIHWNKKIHPGLPFLKHNKSFLLWKNKKFYQGFQKYNKFFVVVLLFLRLELKSAGSRFPNIRKTFFWENMRIFFLILEIESSVSGNINKHHNFFNIWARKLRFGKYICIIYIWKWNCSMKKWLKNLVKRACN